MKPGSRVHATLQLESREALVLPRQAVMEDHGQPTVYRWRAGQFQPVQVKLGPASLGRVVIEEGLSDGDEIALVDPSRPERSAGTSRAQTAASKEPTP
jgi:multidrug efflux pump subunit AcrA (membrane-fusion protein)